jgi:hypothetical protein
MSEDAVTALALAAPALDAQHVELALDVAKDEIGSGHRGPGPSSCGPVVWRSPIELERLMTRLFVRHNVADYRAWRKAYDDFDAERRKLGVIAQAVFQSIDDPNDVTVCHDFSTLQGAKDFGSSARLKEVMGKAGVKGVPQIWFVSEAQ